MGIAGVKSDNGSLVVMIADGFPGVEPWESCSCCAGVTSTAARAKAEESLKVAKARLAEVQAAVAAQTRAAAQAADDYVRANPWQTVGIATAVGVMFGMLITRR